MQGDRLTHLFRLGQVSHPRWERAGQKTNLLAVQLFFGEREQLQVLTHKLFGELNLHRADLVQQRLVIHDHDLEVLHVMSGGTPACSFEDL